MACSSPQQTLYVSDIYSITFAVPVYHERQELGPKDENGNLRSWRFLFVFDDLWLVKEPSHIGEKTRYLGFLAEDFQPRTFWFIVFENIRRLLLSSALIVFAARSNDTGTAAQAIAALIICQLSIKVYQYCMSSVFLKIIFFIDSMIILGLLLLYVRFAADLPFASKTDDQFSELAQWVRSHPCNTSLKSHLNAHVNMRGNNRCS